jgi:hypothetical protein
MHRKLWKSAGVFESAGFSLNLRNINVSSFVNGGGVHGVVLDVGGKPWRDCQSSSSATDSDGSSEGSRVYHTDSESRGALCVCAEAEPSNCYPSNTSNTSNPSNTSKSHRCLTRSSAGSSVECCGEVWRKSDC